MNDAAFLKAILDHPDAPDYDADGHTCGPRLVYADHLDERGDPRGSFIRTQCELARIAALPKHGADELDDSLRPLWCGRATGHVCHARFWEPDCARHRLAAREQRLLAAHPAEWIPDAVHALNRFTQEDVIDGDLIAFRRGFIETVTCTAADWLGGPCPRQWVSMRVHPSDCECKSAGRLPGHAAALRAATPLRKVRLTTWPEAEWGNTVKLVGGTAELGPVLEVIGEMVGPEDSLRREVYTDLLAAEFRGIEFELPPSLAYRTGRNPYLTINEMRAQQGLPAI